VLEVVPLLGKKRPQPIKVAEYGGFLIGQSTWCQIEQLKRVQTDNLVLCLLDEYEFM